MFGYDCHDKYVYECQHENSVSHKKRNLIKHQLTKWGSEIISLYLNSEEASLHFFFYKLMFSIRYSFYLELFIVHEVYSQLESVFTDLVNVSLKMTVHVLNA